MMWHRRKKQANKQETAPKQPKTTQISSNKKTVLLFRVKILLQYLEEVELLSDKSRITNLFLQIVT